MYQAVSNQIDIGVVPHYLEAHSKPNDHQYFWSYTIKVTNLRDMPVQLLSRHWKITDANGILREVKGDGVIGQQPIISPGQFFEYTSGCPLGTEQGFMVGTFDMLDHNGLIFRVNIPAFSLDGPVPLRVVN